PQPFFTPRGTPLSVYYRSLVMAEMGVEIDLLTYGEGRDVDVPGIRILRGPRFRLLGDVPVGPSLLKAWLDLFLFGRAATLLARHDYDFVHAHEEAAFMCLALCPAAGVPFVYDMHSSLPQQLVNFEFTQSRVLRRAFETLEDRALRRAKAVVTISPALARYAEARVPDGGASHHLIENSLVEPVRLADGDTADEAPTEVPLPEGRPVVAYIGTFEAYQGLDLLLPALEIVARERPDAFFLLAGGSPRQVEERRQRARELGLGDDCLFTGTVPRATARSLAERATLLTSPRSKGTNTPLKIYEAMALGTPLVATRVPSHTQVLDDDVCFLADPEPDAFARAVLDALGDPDRRRAVARAAREQYARAYGRDTYRDKVASLLEGLH
ncbi:MAG: glycosyltransferase family 4 protein, partial [Gemmatimonadota bacterium]